MIARKIAEFAERTSFENLPEKAATQAKLCFYDWLIVSVLGSREQQARAVENALLRGSDSDEATVIGRKRRTSSFNASFINGMNSHCLDYDDMHVAMNGHPGAVVFPSILAIAECQNASGRSLITAFALGAEIACRLGLALSPSHYSRGWHATSTAGIFGAAIGASKILKLNSQQIVHAIGFAGTQSSGLQRTFGTAGKLLNVGHATACGLLSAKFAAEELSSPEDIFLDHQGFFSLYADSVNVNQLLGGLGEIFLMEDTLIKRFASCFSTHAPIEAALLLHADPDCNIGAIETVVVKVSEMAINVAGIAKPQTSLEAKFSIGYCVAAALLRGKIDMSTFEAGNVLNLEHQTVASLVRLELDSTIKHDERKATVELKMRGGKKLNASFDLLSNRREVDADWEGITAKSISSLSGEGDELPLSELREKIERLEEVECMRGFVRSFF